MPRAPLPANLDRFLAGAHPAVVGTVQPNGRPATAATWYGWADGRVTLSMGLDGPRQRNLELNPAVSLTVLADDWYVQVTVSGRVVELRPDPELVDMDLISHRYTGAPYEDRESPLATAIVEVDRWNAWGADQL